MNMTSTDATAPTFLTVWAAGESQPSASSMNPIPGSPAIPNGVIAALNSDGELSTFNLAGSVHVFADINGYYVDHDHDDRYYTQDQVDANFAHTNDVYTKDDLKTILPFANSASTTDQILVDRYLPDGCERDCASERRRSGDHQLGNERLSSDRRSGRRVPSSCLTVPHRRRRAPTALGSSGSSRKVQTRTTLRFSGTRAFALAAETSTIFELQCAENGVDGGRTFAAEMTAIFVPTASDL